MMRSHGRAALLATVFAIAACSGPGASNDGGSTGGAGGTHAGGQGGAPTGSGGGLER